MLKLLDLLLRTWKDKYAALNKAVDDYLSSFEALKKTTD